MARDITGTTAPARGSAGFDLLACTLIVISAVVAYIPAIGAAPMLDEQFLFTWAKRAGSHGLSWGDFVGFSGFYPVDFWGALTPLSLKISAILSFGALWMMRAQNICLHVLSSLFLYFLLSRLLSSRAAAAAGAVLFAVVTLNTQAVAWLGGRGAELSGLFFVAGLFCYVLSRNVVAARYGAWSVRSAWTALAASVVLFGLSLLSSAVVLPFLLICPLLEVLMWWRTPLERRGQGTLCVVAALIPLVMACIYVAAVAMIGPTADFKLSGAHHLMYIPAMLFAGGLASVLFHPRLSRVIVVGVVVSAIASGFFIWRTWKQISVYNNNGKYMRRMQKSMVVIGQKTNQPYVIAGGMVPNTGIAPGFEGLPSALFDSHSTLMSSNRVSGGHVKDALKAGQLAGTIVHWEAPFNAFLETDLGKPLESTSPANLDAAAVAELFEPPIHYYRTARLDTAAGELIMDSNSPSSGPVMRLKGDPNWITPLGADFVWIDAQIDGPQSTVDPTIEFYWQTAAAPQYDGKSRKVTASVQLSDGKFHKYFLPLRSVGWVTSGQPTEITIGFPAGAKVRLKGMGTISGDQLMPKFAVQISDNAKAVTPPNFEFPNYPMLGLYVVRRGAEFIPITFDCTNIDGAQGVLLEVSLADRDFGNENGSRLSGQTYRTIPVSGKTGTHRVPLEDWTEPGIYAIRAIAMDGGHNMIGNFSDTSYVYVPLPKRSGWSTR